MSSKWPTFAETARIFKLSAANGRRARALKTSLAISRPEAVRPGDPDYQLVRRRRRQPTHAVPVREIRARLARLK
jgi:hypothetical protein